MPPIEMVKFTRRCKWIRKMWCWQRGKLDERKCAACLTSHLLVTKEFQTKRRPLREKPS